MERKITLQEIEQLHIFVRQHYVEFYDVELELVDHLANDIEAQWHKDTQLSFEQALHIAFKKFGVYGFSDVVDQKINKLSNAYYKASFKVLKEFFTLPKIIVSLALFLLIYVVTRNVSSLNLQLVEDVLLGLGLLFMGFQCVKLYRARREREKRKEKKWLLHSVLFNLEVWPYYIITFLEIRLIMPHDSSPGTHTSMSILSVLLVTITLLYVYILKAIIVPRIWHDLNEQKKKLVNL